MEGRNEERRIGLESSLGDLYKFIYDDREAGKIKKRGPSHRTMCMIGHLYRDPPGPHVPRGIKTVGELYSLTKEEILRGFRFRKKKTWLNLNEILEGYGLPPLNLPEEYTSDQQNS
ncbi:MAG TPA: hypothetical protein ENI23_16765 [bacterium]|nr:hypothetical protein [bacterium]